MVVADSGRSATPAAAAAAVHFFVRDRERRAREWPDERVVCEVVDGRAIRRSESPPAEARLGKASSPPLPHTCFSLFSTVLTADPELSHSTHDDQPIPEERFTATALGPDEVIIYTTNTQLKRCVARVFSDALTSY